MKPRRDSRSFRETLLVVLACLLPLIVLFVVFSLGMQIPLWIFLLILLLCFLLPRWVLPKEQPNTQTVPRETTEAESPSAELKELGRRLAPLFPPEVFMVREWEAAEAGVIFRGEIKIAPEKAVQAVSRRLQEGIGRRVMVLLQEDAEGKPFFLALSEAYAETVDRAIPAQRPWVNVGLLGATLATTTLAGAAHQGINLFKEPAAWVLGLPYALGVMLILGIHELGHYWVARYHGVRVSLPYFIPVPFGLGTFGAFIQMPALLKDRKVLFDIGVTGPLAGLAVAIPALLLGLQWSSVVTGEPDPRAEMQGVSLKSSVLLALLAKLALGEAAAQGHALLLHPLAFAGWLGLMITALNLIPVGQLDGGHIAYALLGRAHAAIVANVALFAMVVLGVFVWPGILFWALLVYFLAGVRGMPPQDDVTDITPLRRGIGLLTFALLFLILSPVPHGFVTTIGLHCPYL